MNSYTFDFSRSLSNIPLILTEDIVPCINNLPSQSNTNWGYRFGTSSLVSKIDTKCHIEIETIIFTSINILQLNFIVNIDDTKHAIIINHETIIDKDDGSLCHMFGARFKLSSVELKTDSSISFEISRKINRIPDMELIENKSSNIKQNIFKVTTIHY